MSARRERVEPAPAPRPLWGLVEDLGAPLREATAWAWLLDQLVTGELRTTPEPLSFDDVDAADLKDALLFQATEQLGVRLRQVRDAAGAVQRSVGATEAAAT